MTRGSLIVWAAALLSTTILNAQTPTITSVTNESGSTSLCPGGIAFANGTNLGTNASSVVLTVGNTDIVIPFATLVRSGTSDASSVYTYNPQLGAVAGLKQFSISNKTRSFRFMATEVDGTGLPMPGNGAATKHDLDFAIDLITGNGSIEADSTLEPKRSTPTSPSWKR